MAPAQVRRASSPGTLDTSHHALWDGQGTTLTIIAVLAALLALITHYLMTFRLGALYSTNKALQTVANGDLTFRLNFFPVRDEFSILAGSIDTFTDRQHKIVQLVEESADALTLAADEFREHASDGEQLARAQRQHMDSPGRRHGADVRRHPGSGPQRQ